jgi:hypothetical protein
MRTSIVTFVMVSFILCLPLQSYAADTIIQETKGNQSPPINVGSGGTANITFSTVYNNLVGPTFSEIYQLHSKCLEVLQNFQRDKLEELDRKLAQLYTQATGAPDEDAKKWVQEQIHKAPEFKKQVEEIDRLREEHNKEFSKKLVAKTYELFIYVFTTIDSKFEAFQELNREIRYEKSEKFNLFSESSYRDTGYVARTFILPNANRILIHCSSGKLDRGLVIAGPSIKFSEVVTDRVTQSFAITPEKGSHTFTIGERPVPFKNKEPLKDVEYPLTGQEMLTGRFKTQFGAIFEEFIKLALAR